MFIFLQNKKIPSLGFTSSMCVCVKSLSRVQLFVTPCTVARQALSMGFSRQEYWSGLPFPSPGHLPSPGISPSSVASSALATGVLITARLGNP